jgi:glycosyltransferase involved in cell wall biosynthesis
MRAKHRVPAPCRTVLMVGTDLRGMGGIRTVVEGYIGAGLLERVECRYVTTHRPGSRTAKLMVALLGWMKVAALLCTMDAPLVHVHLSSRASFWRKSVVCLLARLAGRPYLLHVHGSEFAEFHDESSAAVRRIIRWVLANATLVLALSQAWRVTLQRICPQARVEVLMNAVPVPPLADGAPSGEAARLLFLGEIARHKGVFDLTRAFARVAHALPELRLIYAGTGAAIEQTRDLTAQLGLGERCEFTGWLGAERKRAELAAASLFVLPSYVEGMPMALLEAMSWGLPVIATAVGGVPEVLTHEVNGLLLAPGDIDALAAAIERLMREPQLRARLGRAARETVAARFSLDCAFERLLGIYRGFGIEPRAALGQSRVPLGEMASEP